MLSPDTTAGACALRRFVVGNVNPSSDLEPYAGDVISMVAKTIVAAITRVDVVTKTLFVLLLLRLFFISMPTANTMHKRILLIERR